MRRNPWNIVFITGKTLVNLLIATSQNGHVPRGTVNRFHFSCRHLLVAYFILN